MKVDQLQYLRAINQQLGGPIRAAMPDKMSAYLLDCVFSILTRMIVDAGLTEKLRKAMQCVLKEQLGTLRSLLAGSGDARALLDDIEAITVVDVPDERVDCVAARVSAWLTHQNTPEALRIARVLVEADADGWSALQAERDRLRIEANERVEREVVALNEEEQQRLLVLLRRECGEAEELAIAKVFAVPGGYSKQTIIITLRNHRNLPEQIVVRRDRAESPVETSVVDELELLQTLYAKGLRVPRPWVLDRGTVLGMPLMVVSKVEGHNIGDVFNVWERQEQYALDLADELAKLHVVPLSVVRADMPGRQESNLAFMRRELDKYVTHWRECGARSVTMDAGAEWLLNHLHWADSPERAVIHRDARFHNILCEDGELKALLDWELAMIGHPARDLGWAYYQVGQMTSWENFFGRYRASGGPDCSMESLTFYTIYTEWYCAVQMYRAREAFLSGRAPFAYLYAGEEMRHQNVKIVGELLRQVMSNGTL